MPLLFSYGTLRQPEVQIGTFGRTLNESADRLPGYVVGCIAIADPAVVALSGSASHPILRPTEDPVASVVGMALEVTEVELALADAYEDPAYVRRLVTLASGRAAFAYVAKSARSRDA